MSFPPVLSSLLSRRCFSRNPSDTVLFSLYRPMWFMVWDPFCLASTHTCWLLNALSTSLAPTGFLLTFLCWSMITATCWRGWENKWAFPAFTLTGGQGRKVLGVNAMVLNNYVLNWIFKINVIPFFLYLPVKRCKWVLLSSLLSICTVQCFTLCIDNYFQSLYPQKILVFISFEIEKGT